MTCVSCTDLQVADIGDLKLLQEYGVGNALQQMHRNTVQPSTQQHTNKHLHITCNTSQTWHQHTHAYMYTNIHTSLATLLTPHHCNTYVQTATCIHVQHFLNLNKHIWTSALTATLLKPQHTCTSTYGHLQNFSNPNIQIQTSVNTIIRNTFQPQHIHVYKPL